MVKVRSERIFACRPMFCGLLVSRCILKEVSGVFWHETHKHDKFHETLATHQASNGEGFPPLKLIEFRSERTTNDFASEGHGDDTNHVAPGNTIIQQAQVSAQAR